MREFFARLFQRRRHAFRPSETARRTGAGTAECASPMGAVFSAIYRANAWNDGESRSGPGSRVARTAVVRQGLGRLLRELRVGVLLDAPCGDFNWTKELPLPRTRYIGVDVVGELIEENGRRHGGPRRTFQIADITVDVPRSDLILCRDCLVHLSFADVFRALAVLRRSGARHLLTTTFPALGRNQDIATGDWRPLNLERPPFSLPRPLRYLTDGCTAPGYTDKALALWELQQLRVAG